jgi:hypothetical protein
MKKAICVLVALLAFTCGVFVFYIRPLVIPISLSELRENTSHYKSRKFKVVGKLEVWEAESIYSINLKDWENDCSGEPGCFRGLEMSEEVKAENILLIKELAEKNKTFGKTDFRRGEYLADVEITGNLVEKGRDPFFGGTIYEIKVEKLKQISPIKFVLIEDMR